MKNSKFELAMAALLVAAGCSVRHDLHCTDRACKAAEHGLSSAIALISPATCATRNGRLLQCAIASQTLSFSSFETAVPLRTTVVSQRSGNCSTQFPLQIALQPDGEAAATFPYIQGGQTIIRRHDGGVITALTLTDSSPWTPSASFDVSCAITLQVSANEVDVNSKADAQAIIDKLTKDLNAKQATATNDHALLLYSQAYTFMRTLAENFLGQLTEDSMQQLRASALTAAPALAQVITDCSLSKDQRMGLYNLSRALGTLGHPEDWRNADGSIKTLHDFLGPDDQQVINTIQQLASGGTPPDGGTSDGGTPVDYQALYEQAQRDVAAAQHKLTLAQQQLASYLN